MVGLRVSFRDSILRYTPASKLPLLVFPLYIFIKIRYSY
jgi:hypothetical protein